MTVPNIVDIVALTDATMKEFTAEFIRAVFSNNRTYHSKENPFQSIEYRDVLKEYTTMMPKGIYKKLSTKNA